jgi:tyrosine-protein phosphatase YwqE
MSSIQQIHEQIREKARKTDTESLMLALEYGDEIRLTDHIRSDISNLQALNMSIACMIDVLVERDPALDAAIDVWCDNLSDGRTMARFIVDRHRGI